MADTTIIQVAPEEFCRIPVAAAALGYSEKAIRRKMEEGVWTRTKSRGKAGGSCGHIAQRDAPAMPAQSPSIAPGIALSALLQSRSH